MSTNHYITTNQSGLNTGTGDVSLEAQGVVISGDIDMRYQSDDVTFNGGGSQTVDISGGILGAIDDYSGATSGNDSITITPTGYIDYYWFGAVELAGGGNTVINEGSITATNYAGAIQIVGSVGIDQLDPDTIVNTGVISGSETVGRTGDSVVDCVGSAAVEIDNSGSILAGAGAIGIDLGSSADGNSIYNSGLITGGMTLSGGRATVTNTGTIEGPISVSHGTWLSNSGLITGAVSFLGGADQLTVNNHGTMDGLYANGAAGSDFHNYNAIDGLVQLGDGVTTATNSGTITGNVAIGNAAGADFVNTGTINGSVRLGGNGQTFDGTGGSVTGTVFGGSGNDNVIGGSGADRFDLSTGGTDSAFGGDGNDQFLLGAALTPADTIDGGNGFDTVILNGNYSAGLTFAPTTMTNVERLLLPARTQLQIDAGRRHCRGGPDPDRRRLDLGCE